MRNIAALFSLLMPGFGQVYNSQFIKGMVFLAIEHFDNMVGNINTAIQLDFNGAHLQALEAVNYDGMLFYPGFYVYVVWDAWYFAKEGGNKTASAIPFVIGGFLGTLGAIFAERLPVPTLTVSMLMIIPMVVGMVIFRKE